MENPDVLHKQLADLLESGEAEIRQAHQAASEALAECMRAASRKEVVSLYTAACYAVLMGDHRWTIIRELTSKTLQA